jgi:hypothetical protein
MSVSFTSDVSVRPFRVEYSQQCSGISGLIVTNQSCRLLVTARQLYRRGIIKAERGSKFL